MSLDSIDCGAGFDRVYVNRSDRVFNCEAITRLAAEWCRALVRMGTSGDDVLNELDWNGADLIFGLAGIDYLNGHAGADMLWGNEGDDVLDGDHGPDLLLGGPDNDLLIGKFRK